MDKELEDALNKVLKAPDKGFIPYAKTYAGAALCNPYTGVVMEGDELHTQLLYVLSNLTHWRGYEAQVVKDVLRQYAGVKLIKKKYKKGS